MTGLLVWACLACLAPAGAAAVEPDSDIRVVLLHGVDAADARTRALARGLADGLGGRGTVTAVLLGSQRQGDEHFHARYQALHAAWGNASPTAVIADGEAAFAFVRKYRDALFADAPVIYCGMPAPDPEYLRQCGDCAGLPSPADHTGTAAATLRLAFDLRPQTRLVVGIMDGSPETVELRRAAEAAMEPYLDRARIVFPGHEPGDEGGLTLAGLRGAAHGVPGGSGVALFMGFSRDARGNPVDEAEAVAMLASRSGGPVLALSDRYVGTGAACAVTVPGHDLGAALAGLVLRAAAGEPVREMLPEPLAPRPVLDLTALARFGIPAQRLPGDALTVNDVVRPDEPAEVLPAGAGVAAASVAGLVTIYLLARWLVRWLARRRAERP